MEEQLCEEMIMQLNNQTNYEDGSWECTVDFALSSVKMKYVEGDSQSPEAIAGIVLAVTFGVLLLIGLAVVALQAKNRRSTEFV